MAVALPKVGTSDTSDHTSTPKLITINNGFWKGSFAVVCPDPNRCIPVLNSSYRKDPVVFIGKLQSHVRTRQFPAPKTQFLASIFLKVQ